MAAKQHCLVTEATTQIDACACKAADVYKCNLPDSTCRQRTLAAGSDTTTVRKAHGYDVRVTAQTAENKKKNELRAKCPQRRGCVHKAAPVPSPVGADQEADNGQTPPNGDGSRGDCEIAQQVRHR